MKKTIEDLLHIRPNIKRKEGKTGLALYLTSGRIFYDVLLWEIRFSVVKLNDTEKTDIRSLKHGLGEYEKAFGGNVAYCITDLSRRKREALISSGIPFIAPPGQLYLPFLGVVLQERFPKERIVLKERMSPLEQLLFLFLLYRGEKHTKAELADRLHVTRAAITKVTADLLLKELIQENKVGKEVFVSLSDNPKACYEKARKWLVDPIKRIVYCANCDVCNDFLKAGETALSGLSLLAEPRNEVRACSEKDRRLAGLNLVEDDNWEKDRNMVRIEIWKYDPGIISEGDYVDVISMALSLTGIHDERVQGELQDIMEEKGWQ